jgi:hypothetical protein
MQNTKTDSLDTSIDTVKKFIKKASLKELRILEIVMKDRKYDVISKGIEEEPIIASIVVSKINGKEYLYLQEYIKGKRKTRKLKEKEFDFFNFEMVKISPEAKRVLGEKYKIEF